jgi:hypothetical protein
MFTATFIESSSDSCDATGTVSFFFDGGPLGSAVPDHSGWASVQVTLTNATLGNHTISVVDSCGEHASTTYMVFGTPRGKSLVVSR